MTSVMVYTAFYGGPQDGDMRQIASDDCLVDIPGHVFATEAHSGQKMYRYVRQSRWLFGYSHEWIDNERRGGGEEDMGMKKFGTGQIIETETEQEDISKTASQQWQDADEQGLEDEGGK